MRRPILGILFALAFLLPSAALGQGFSRPGYGMVTNGLGQPIAGASIYVCAGSVTVNLSAIPPCTPAATIYSDYALQHAITQPLYSDGLGNYMYYVAAQGAYTEVVTGPTIKGTSAVVTIGYGNGVPVTTVSGLNAYTSIGLARVTDGVSSTDCTMGGGSALVTCQYSGSSWDAVGSGGGGTPNGAVTFTNQTSVTFSIVGSSYYAVPTCWDNASPANEITPSSTTLNTTTNVLTFNFAVPQSGFCVANTNESAVTSGTITPSAQYSILAQMSPGTGNGAAGIGVMTDSTGNNLTVPGKLTTPNINNVIYVDGTTYKTVDAAVDALPSCTDGFISLSSIGTYSHCGKVIVPSSTVTQTTTISVNPYLQIDQDRGGIINYTGTGYAIQCTRNDTAYVGQTFIQGLHIVGTSAASGGIDIQSCTDAQIRDNIIEGFTNGPGIVLENTSAGTSTEQVVIFHNILNNNGSPEIAFEDNCSGHTGCPSFEYTRLYGNTIWANASGYGVELENDATLSHSDIELHCFVYQSSACLYLAGTSTMQFGRTFLYGELGLGATSATGLKTDSGTTFQQQGFIEDWLTGVTDSIAGTFYTYVVHNPNDAETYADAHGNCTKIQGGSYIGCVYDDNLTANRAFQNPDAPGTYALEGSTCTMATGTTCTSTVTYGTHCVATDQAAAIAGACSISGTTLTVTAASSNSDIWAWSIVN